MVAEHHAITRLVGAVLMALYDEWAEARRCMGAEIVSNAGAMRAAPAEDTPGQVKP